MVKPLVVHIVGAGWVGLVTAGIFASVGHRVVVLDRDARRLALLREGDLPMYEPDLLALLASGVARDVIAYTLLPHVTERPDVVFCCVGTPQGEDGSADVSSVFSSADFYEQRFPGTVFIVKSTVPPGTSARLRSLYPSLLFGSNPEFLAEGTAVRDGLFPSRIVCGSAHEAVRTVCERIYQSWIERGVPFLVTDCVTAELAKYAANVCLATKISFVNELEELADQVGARMEDVVRSMRFDARIGPHFLAYGIGYGGSCFPKDTQAILALARAQAIDLPIIRAAEERNARQRERYTQKIIHAFERSGRLGHVAFLGMSYKEGTDDVRSSPAGDIFTRLVARGIPVKWYDPQVCSFLGIAREESCASACAGASLIFVATLWPDILAYVKGISQERVVWGRAHDTL